jgi:hypothetical protein
MFVKRKRNTHSENEELEVRKVKKNTFVSLDSTDTKNSIISKSTYQGSQRQNSRKTSLELSNEKEFDGKEFERSYSKNTKLEEDSNKYLCSTRSDNEDEDQSAGSLRIVPVRTIVENNKLTLGEEGVKSISPQVLLREKLKRDFFGQDCILSLEQMLQIIKLKLIKKDQSEESLKEVRMEDIIKDSESTEINEISC